jgi:hypothetical protein
LKNLALTAAILLVGCATGSVPSDSGKRIEGREQQSGEIAQRERRCEDGAASRTGDEIARIRIGHEPFAEEHVRLAQDEGEQELSQCKANADREKEELSSQERSEYELQGREERERSSLMMVLTTSRPR